MILGIDASNLRTGGGLTHLGSLVEVARPTEWGIDQVVVWGSPRTLQTLVHRSWLRLVPERSLQGPLPQRVFWQQITLPKRAGEARCDVLFSPGGIIPMRHAPCPVVTMSQNLLPFDTASLRRYHWSSRPRLLALRRAQSISFTRADAVIFLTDYARTIVSTRLAFSPKRTAVISHGVAERFRLPPRIQEPIDRYDDHRPFRILYVSVVDSYKHHPILVRAVASLRAQGVPVQLEVVGPGFRPALAAFNMEMRRSDPAGRFVRYRGPVPYSEVHRIYHEADVFVFSSTCENLPNSLLEAMAAGLPIASSRTEPMSSVVGDAGVLFDAMDRRSVARTLVALITDPLLRARVAERAYVRAQAFSWERCAEDTFRLLGNVAADARH